MYAIGQQNFLPIKSETIKRRGQRNNKIRLTPVFYSFIFTRDALFPQRSYTGWNCTDVYTHMLPIIKTLKIKFTLGRFHMMQIYKRFNCHRLSYKEVDHMIHVKRRCLSNVIENLCSNSSDDFFFQFYFEISYFPSCSTSLNIRG